MSMKLGSRSGSLSTLTLTTVAFLFVGCGTSSPGTGGTGGASSGTGGSSSSTGGSPGTGGTPATGGSPGTGGSPSTGGSPGSGGTPATGGSTGSGGAVSTGGKGGSTSTGTGGSAGSGGHGGAAMGGHAGSTSTGTGGAAATGGGSGSGDCPSNATFCSGFEESSGPPANMPVGTATVEAYNGTFTDLMALDTTVVHSGKQSLKVLSGSSGSAYRMLSVPIPGPTFWVRMYMRSDVTFGDMTAVHNAFFQGMMTPDPNSAGQVQFAEQWCQVLLNVSDKLFPDGLSSCSTTGPTISANTWHCVEALFDGPNGNVQVYSDGTKLIDAQNWSYAKETYGAFEFGFHQYSGPARNLWYDDVVVAPSRVGCP
jgi:hypothetical protein